MVYLPITAWILYICPLIFLLLGLRENQFIHLLEQFVGNKVQVDSSTKSSKTSMHVTQSP